VAVDGAPVQAPPGPVIVALAPGRHELALVVEATPYERRIACGERPRVGAAVRTIEGLGMLRFESPHAAKGGGSAVVYVPPGHDVRRAAPLLVGAHPWNGSIWTYAAYADLLHEARACNVVLLMPSGLGNSLYTAEAEDEVMRAIGALASVVAVDPQRVSLWGASMGGAGATTIGFHHPDRFASVTSFFGDSKYDRSTYVRALLPDEGAAHRVNALDVVDNARHLPVWLIHGESDVTSPIRQSQLLARALEARGFSVRFDHIAGIGHSGALVGRYLAAVVDVAASARVPHPVGRVTYRSLRPEDDGAYGVRLERDPAAEGGDQGSDAFVDVERRDDGIHVVRAVGVGSV
jgi:enterochelin esterase-like enzyme